MQAVVDAFTWTAKRLAVALAILSGLVLLAYTLLVAVIVVGQAATGLGH